MLEPAPALLFVDSVFGPNETHCSLLVCDTETWPSQHHTEVQEDHRSQNLGHIWCVLKSQNQSFQYLRSDFSGAHIPTLSNLSPDFICLGSVNYRVNCNLFISPDAKGPSAVSSFEKYFVLACELLQNLGCLTLSLLPYTDIEAEPVDTKFLHGVLLFTVNLAHKWSPERETVSLYF